MRMVVALTVSLVLFGLLTPTVGADHAYSHRFVFEGRVVTPDGLPVVGENVTFYSTGQRFEHACPGTAHENITNEDGDFRFCFHVHELDPSTRVGVRVAGTQIEKPMDTAFRRSIVLLHAPDANGTASDSWNQSYRIAGKLWRSGNAIVEGVPVFGTALAGVEVNVTLTLPNGETVESQLISDAYGDYDAVYTLANGTEPSTVSVNLEALGQIQRTRFDAVSHRSTVGFIFRGDNQGAPIDASFPANTVVGVPPGSASPSVPAVLVTTVALAVLLVIALLKRKES